MRSISQGQVFPGKVMWTPPSGWGDGGVVCCDIGVLQEKGNGWKGHASPRGKHSICKLEFPYAKLLPACCCCCLPAWKGFWRIWNLLLILYNLEISHKSLFCFGFWDRVLCIPGWLWTHYIATDDLLLLIHLLPPSKCWLYRVVPPCSVLFWAKDQTQGLQ